MERKYLEAVHIDPAGLHIGSEAVHIDPAGLHLGSEAVHFDPAEVPEVGLERDHTLLFEVKGLELEGRS
ncbi:MAG: hypothetical protein LBE38_05865 [Deltaproteobacteria bacterium]|nr:hypothetical protein [Deltaproteobacteria bacterium]